MDDRGQDTHAASGGCEAKIHVHKLESETTHSTASLRDVLGKIKLPYMHLLVKEY